MTKVQFGFLLFNWLNMFLSGFWLVGFGHQWHLLWSISLHVFVSLRHPSVDCWYVFTMNTCGLNWQPQILPGVSSTFMFLCNSKQVWWWWWRRKRGSGPALSRLAELWWWWRRKQRWPPGVNSLSAMKTARLTSKSSAAVWRLVHEDRWAAHLRITQHRSVSHLSQTAHKVLL